MAVIVVGVILGLITGAPILGFLQGASRNWLLVSNLLILIAFLFGPPLIFLPWRKRLNPALDDALARGQMTLELRAYTNDPVVSMAHWAELVGMGLVLVLMVFKPF